MKSADAVISGKFKEHITYFLTDSNILNLLHVLPHHWLSVLKVERRATFNYEIKIKQFINTYFV